MMTFTETRGLPVVETERNQLDLTVVGSFAKMFTRDMTTASVQAHLQSGAYGDAVLSVQRSLDGENYYAIDTPITLTANGIAAGIDVTGYAWIRVIVTTAAASPARANITIFAQRGPGV